MTVHIAKNFMELPKIKVPLILGIWGGKGQGKTFQCMLAYKKLGIGPVVMSAGAFSSNHVGLHFLLQLHAMHPPLPFTLENDAP